MEALSASLVLGVIGRGGAPQGALGRRHHLDPRILLHVDLDGARSSALAHSLLTTERHRVTQDDTRGRHVEPRFVPGCSDLRIRCPKGRGGSTPPSRTRSDLRIFVPGPSNRVTQEAVLLTLSPDYGASRTFMPRRNGAAHITSRGYEPSSLTEVFGNGAREPGRPTWSAGPEGACCWSPTRQSTSPPGAPLP
jgi:hypothetical protein